MRYAARRKYIMQQFHALRVHYQVHTVRARAPRCEGAEMQEFSAAHKFYDLFPLLTNLFLHMYLHLLLQYNARVADKTRRMRGE